MSEQLVAVVEGYVNEMQKVDSNTQELRQMEQTAGKAGVALMGIAGGLVVASEVADQIADAVEGSVSVNYSAESAVVGVAREVADVTDDAALGFGVVGVIALGYWGMTRFLRKKSEKIAHDSTRRLRIAAEQDEIIAQAFSTEAEQ